MIDLHCHILPGIDDGAQNFENSTAMARSAVDQGIRHIVATPHHNVRNWQNPKATVTPLVDQVNQAYAAQDIDLTVSAGQEVRISGDLIDLIDRDEICFLDGKESYLLVEFPTSSVPEYTSQVFYQLYEREITPIIAHPERNHAIFEKPDLLYDLVNGGALAQVTSSSYTGDLGKKIEKFTKQLIEANLVQIVASDAHNTTTRPFNMDRALIKLGKEYGEETRAWFEENSQRVFDGTYFQPGQVEKVRRKRFFGLF